MSLYEAYLHVRLEVEFFAAVFNATKYFVRAKWSAAKLAETGYL